MNNLKRIESELIRACIAGERSAQNQLYDQFKAKMYGLCLRYAKTQEEAEDMLLEGFFKVFNDLHQFRQEGSLEGWIRRVMVHNAISHLRKNRKKEMIEVGMEKLSSQNGENPAVLEKTDAESIIRLIRELPIGYQTIFNLFAVEGYSHKEIAAMMQIAESTSRSQYVRARQMLQKMLTPQSKQS